MAGSTFGNRISVTTWGESHGKALGVVIDGFPAGLKLSEEDIQPYLDRRKPGQSKYTTARAEGDEVVILSGVFEGITTGTPISLMIKTKISTRRTMEILPLLLGLAMLITVSLKSLALETTAVVGVHLEEKLSAV